MQDSYGWCIPEDKALADAATRAYDSKGNKLTHWQHWESVAGCDDREGVAEAADWSSRVCRAATDCADCPPLRSSALIWGFEKSCQKTNPLLIFEKSDIEVYVQELAILRCEASSKMH